MYGLDEIRNRFRFVLLIAVHCYKPIKAIELGPPEHVLHGSAITSIFRMTNDLD